MNLKPFTARASCKITSSECRPCINCIDFSFEEAIYNCWSMTEFSSWNLRVPSKRCIFLIKCMFIISSLVCHLQCKNSFLRKNLTNFICWNRTINFIALWSHFLRAYRRVIPRTRIRRLHSGNFWSRPLRQDRLPPRHIATRLQWRIIPGRQTWIPFNICGTELREILNRENSSLACQCFVWK